MYKVIIDDLFIGDHMEIAGILYMVTQIEHNTTDKTIHIMVAESKANVDK